jgi:hypothetical protein
MLDLLLEEGNGRREVYIHEWQSRAKPRGYTFPHYSSFREVRNPIVY